MILSPQTTPSSGGNDTSRTGCSSSANPAADAASGTVPFPSRWIQSAQELPPSKTSVLPWSMRFDDDEIEDGFYPFTLPPGYLLSVTALISIVFSISSILSPGVAIAAHMRTAQAAFMVLAIFGDVILGRNLFSLSVVQVGKIHHALRGGIMCVFLLSSIAGRLDLSSCWQRSHDQDCYYPINIGTFGAGMIIPLIFTINFQWLAIYIASFPIVEIIFSAGIDPPEFPVPMRVGRFLFYVFLGTFCNMLFRQREKEDRLRYLVEQSLLRLEARVSAQREKVAKTLRSLCPPQQLKALILGRTVYDEASICTVLITEIFDFPVWRQLHRPDAAINWIDIMYDAFDELRVRHNIEKLYVRGDMYAASLGLRTKHKKRNQQSSGKHSPTEWTPSSEGSTQEKEAPEHDAHAIIYFAMRQHGVAVDISGAAGSDLLLRSGFGTGPCAGVLLSGLRASYLLKGTAFSKAQEALHRSEPGKLFVGMETLQQASTFGTELLVTAANSPPSNESTRGSPTGTEDEERTTDSRECEVVAEEVSEPGERQEEDTTQPPRATTGTHLALEQPQLQIVAVRLRRRKKTSTREAQQRALAIAEEGNPLGISSSSGGSTTRRRAPADEEPSDEEDNTTAARNTDSVSESVDSPMAFSGPPGHIGEMGPLEEYMQVQKEWKGEQRSARVVQGLQEAKRTWTVASLCGVREISRLREYTATLASERFRFYAAVWSGCNATLLSISVVTNTVTLASGILAATAFVLLLVGVANFKFVIYPLQLAAERDDDEADLQRHTSPRQGRESNKKGVDEGSSIDRDAIRKGSGASLVKEDHEQQEQEGEREATTAAKVDVVPEKKRARFSPNGFYFAFHLSQAALLVAGQVAAATGPLNNDPGLLVTIGILFSTVGDGAPLFVSSVALLVLYLVPVLLSMYFHSFASSPASAEVTVALGACIVIVMAGSRYASLRRRFLDLCIQQSLFEAAEEDRDIHEKVLCMLLPPYIVPHVVRKREGEWTAVADSLDDMAILHIKLPTMDSIREVKALCTQLYSLVGRKTVIDILFLDGDTVVIGGPLQRPAVSRKDLCATSAVANAPVRQIASERAASAVSNELVETLCSLCTHLLCSWSMGSSDSPSASEGEWSSSPTASSAMAKCKLSAVLHRSDGMAIVFGATEPTFAIEGKVIEVSTSVLSSLAAGELVATRSFTDALEDPTLWGKQSFKVGRTHHCRYRGVGYVDLAELSYLSTDIFGRSPQELMKPFPRSTTPSTMGGGSSKGSETSSRGRAAG